MKRNPSEEKHIGMLRPYLSECTVLLKKNGDFPLEKPCQIAAYGPGVRHTVKGGTGSGEVNSSGFVSVEEGLEAAGFTITTRNWLKHYERHYEKARAMHFLGLKRDARRKRTLAVVEGMGKPVREPVRGHPSGSCQGAILIPAVLGSSQQQPTWGLLAPAFLE